MLVWRVRLSCHPVNLKHELDYVKCIALCVCVCFARRLRNITGKIIRVQMSFNDRMPEGPDGSIGRKPLSRHDLDFPVSRTIIVYSEKKIVPRS